MTNTNRPLYLIAADIKKDWKNIYFGAVPYLEALQCLRDKNDKYGQDSATSIVCYFLANAGTWRGEVAKTVKKELKSIVGLK